MLAVSLVEGLNADDPGCAAVLPMDGFHYDDLYLTPAGLRPRKGAPDTFDGLVRVTAGRLHLAQHVRPVSKFEGLLSRLATSVPDRPSKLCLCRFHTPPSANTVIEQMLVSFNKSEVILPMGAAAHESLRNRDQGRN